MPATLPYARCGNLAVPPETGYIPPSSACTRARKMTATPPMTQPSRAIGPAACEAYSAPNSQPDPMMEFSDAQAIFVSPISRLRPTSDGTVVGAATDSVAMVQNLLSGPHTWAIRPVSRPMLRIVKQPED